MDVLALQNLSSILECDFICLSPAGEFFSISSISTTWCGSCWKNRE